LKHSRMLLFRVVAQMLSIAEKTTRKGIWGSFDWLGFKHPTEVDGKKRPTQRGVSCKSSSANWWKSSSGKGQAAG
jgi:catabolite regulation protein CreA